jgi:ABC-type multidrug transport system fused ATPase/permease subunit
MNSAVRHYLFLLTRYVAPQGWRVGVLAVTLVGSIVSQLVLPQLIARFIDSAFTPQATDSLLTLALAYIGFAVVGQVLNIAATYLASYVGWTATNHLRADLAEHALHLDLSFHKSHTPGELIERVDGDVNTLTRFFSRFFIIVASNLLLMLGVVILLYRENWIAGTGALGFALLFLYLMLNLRDIAVPHFAEYRQLSSEFYGLTGEHLAAREDVRANGAVAFVMNRIDRLMQKWMMAWHKARLASTVLWITTIVMYVGGSVVSLGIGGYLFLQGAATIGTVYLLYNYFLQISQPIERIREELEQLQNADAGILRIMGLLETPTRLSAGGNASLPEGAFDVACDHLSFRYEEGQDSLSPSRKAEQEGEVATDTEQEWILRDLTFALQAGETVGLLGRTGSGKSTLARLFLRLYDPQGGAIRYSGVALKDAPLTELRQRVGLVTQDVQLFQGTVRDNITFFDSTINDAQIQETVALLGLENWLNSLPQGLDTELGGDGNTLSAGEAQLLAFTRVFLKDPGLVILDEASSRLDPTTERRIERAVDRLLAGRTGVIIAHRLATVERVDKILILEHGRMVEFGARTTLAQNPDSRFAHLLRVGLSEVLA